MLVEYLEDFCLDIDYLHLKSVKLALIRIIGLMETAKSIDELPNLKKLKGHKSAYRIRVGNYRLGFFYENNKLILARFIHRKDIYSNFP